MCLERKNADIRMFQEWLKRWSTSWTISKDDLTILRDKFGEKVLPTSIPDIAGRVIR